jgi:hypothetical protein
LLLRELLRLLLHKLMRLLLRELLRLLICLGLRVEMCYGDRTRIQARRSHVPELVMVEQEERLAVTSPVGRAPVLLLLRNEDSDRCFRG